MSHRYLATVLSWVGLATACSSGGVQTGAQPQAQTQAFIELLGTDTISIESFTRTAAGFKGQLVTRSPVTRVAEYEASLASDGTIRQLDVQWRTPPENPDGPPPLEFTVTLDGDSATVVRSGGRNPGTTRLAAPGGTIPTVGKSPIAFAVFEQAVREAIASGSDDFPINLLNGRNGRTSPNAIVRFAPDSVSFDYFGNPFVARVDASGAVLGRSGARTTVKVEGMRIAPPDIDGLAAEFAARDARGEGLGVASPQATVTAAVAGANVTIVYSRPAKRGREIWGVGGLVPRNEVWRTGANSATAFEVDRDVMIGGVLIPAGAYTLWSTYTASSAQLIINSQTGQWGTSYDADQDLVRIDMEATTLSDTVERFTISIEQTADGGVLQLSWDAMQFYVPIVAN
ncbi:MAG: DUF2911 domain-containing protein [Gemmatimonadota bacterium]